jgi:hypothetical protein
MTKKEQRKQEEQRAKSETHLFQQTYDPYSIQKGKTSLLSNILGVKKYVRKKIPPRNNIKKMGMMVTKANAPSITCVLFSGQRFCPKLYENKSFIRDICPMEHSNRAKTKVCSSESTNG